MHMWYWFFEARTDASTAPLTLWLNGGPGCSSMIGLFQEHGPCHFVNGETEPSLNEYSWNTVSNMLYVDQPIGTGFSYGTDSATSTVTAAEYVWYVCPRLILIFFSKSLQTLRLFRDFEVLQDETVGCDFHHSQVILSPGDSSCSVVVLMMSDTDNRE